MKNRLKKLSKQDWFSFIGIFLVTIGNYFCSSWIDMPLRNVIGVSVITIGSILLFTDVINNFKNKIYTKKQLKIICVITILCSLVFHRLDVYFVSLIIAMSFLNKNLKFMFKCLFFSMLIGILIIVFLNLLNIIPDFISYREVEGVITHRYSLGFRNPNVLFRLYMSMTLCGVIAFDKNKIYMFITFLLGLLMYRLTDSRMGLVMLFLVFMIGLLPIKFLKKISFNKAFPYLFIFGLLISIATALLFEKGIINNILSYRPEFWKVYIEDLEFFGRFKRITAEHIENGVKMDVIMPLDNLYLHILCYGGIYGFMVYSVLFFAAFKNAKTKENYHLFIIFLITFIYGYIEDFSNQNESMFVILLIMMLLDKNKMEELKEDSLNENSSN